MRHVAQSARFAGMLDVLTVGGGRDLLSPVDRSALSRKIIFFCTGRSTKYRHASHS